MNLLLQPGWYLALGPELEGNGGVEMCFWILWFQSGDAFQTRVGPVQTVKLAKPASPPLSSPLARSEPEEARLWDQIHMIPVWSTHYVPRNIPGALPALPWFNLPMFPWAPLTGNCLLSGICCPERLSNLPKVTQVVSG